MTTTRGLLTALSTYADETLSWVTYAARDTVAGVDYVTITVVGDDGALSTVGSTDPVALRADSLQYSLRQGPAMAALQGAQMAVSSDVRDDARWPGYGPRASALGIRAQAALGLRWADQPVGALNLYSTRSEPFTVDALALARQYAGHASAAWEIVRRAQRTRVPTQRQSAERPLAS